MTPKRLSKTTKRKKNAIKSISWLKKRADKVFSMYIRQKYADWRGYAKCVTCGKTLHWKELQNGHFLSRAYTLTRYREENCHPQCLRCNVFLKGNMIKYYQFMEKTYGKDKIIELQKLTFKHHDFLRIELEEIIEKYKDYRI